MVHPVRTAIAVQIVLLAGGCSHEQELDEIRRRAEAESKGLAVCTEGTGRCGGEEECVDILGSPEHCGPQCEVCPGAEHAQPRCTAGECGSTCDADFTACGDDAACYDVENDPTHCGPRCVPCPAPRDGQAACSQGRCAIECDPQFHAEQGECVERPGCVGLRSACGAGDDCCRLDAIAQDGEAIRFQRGYDASGNATDLTDVWRARNVAEQITVDPFELDHYEVTVSRFRLFVAAYDGWRRVQPRAGFAAHPAVVASGWQAEWTAAIGLGPDGEAPLVPEDAAALRSALVACARPTWSDEPGDKENHPINCVTFFEAFLFCMWDGGRLPSEAEWHAAASGGAEQRPFPWSGERGTKRTDIVIPRDFVRYGQGDVSPSAVGAAPAGAGRWGTEDLAGNVYEWTRDTERADGACGESPQFGFGLCDYPAGPSNPFELRGDVWETSRRHILRGGSYKFEAFRLRNVARELRGGLLRVEDIGFRCARPRTAT